jgi:hypothetical protein
VVLVFKFTTRILTFKGCLSYCSVVLPSLGDAVAVQIQQNEEDSTVKTVSVIAAVGIQSVKRGAGEDRRDAATHK